MASKYSVIQYVPDPIADERINIGVLAFDHDQVCVKFLQSWERVRNFSQTDISFLHDFAQRMHESAESGLLFPGDIPNEISRYDRLREVALGNINSIQFTEPRASLEDVNSLMEDIAYSFLVDRPTQKSTARDRQAAARVTTSKIKKVLKDRIGDRGKDYLKHSLQGIKGNHEFDAVVANGSPYLAAHGISFEVNIQSLHLDSLYWRVADIKECLPNFPIAIVSLPPKIESENYLQLSRSYQKTTEILKGMDAKVIAEEEIEEWANQTLMAINI